MSTVLDHGEAATDFGLTTVIPPPSLYYLCIIVFGLDCCLCAYRSIIYTIQLISSLKKGIKTGNYVLFVYDYVYWIIEVYIIHLYV